mmetsp:Transcript_29552/g.95283  ORF Transcript_29552/g.95283 Transcript_29552/m.95283 type:complete len:149 (-) Transcript_29552:892-1338(-)
METCRRRALAAALVLATSLVGAASLVGVAATGKCWARFCDGQDCYKELRVPSDAAAIDVKRGYKKLCLRLSTDKGYDPDPEGTEACRLRYNPAYDVLMERRGAFDRCRTCRLYGRCHWAATMLQYLLYHLSFGCVALVFTVDRTAKTR